ncbi:MAG: RagB/SusD family nutrient uptake outer membrane protein [Bacteroidales bacterium]|nr:RagB/SusD family nutrient uptake outer membrane protein [Candidatus Cryptobacteroides faecihippi]
MKQIKKAYLSIILAILIPGLSSCGDYLYVEPIGQSTIASFFYDIEGLTAAGIGMHAEMVGFHDSDYTKYAELMGDMLNLNPVYAGEGDVFLTNYRMLPSYDASYPYNIWKAGYGAITNANNILYYGPDLRERYPKNLKEIDKNLGYAHFARALIHFDLCNCYARPYNYTPDASHIGIPVVDYIPSFESVIKRSSVKSVYDLIVSDLKEAIELLDGVNGDIYYVTQDAAKALLARIYLYMEEWDKAAELSSELMQKYELTPRKDYVDMFRNAKVVPGSEMIFRFNQFSKTSSMRSFYDPTATQDALPCPVITTYYEADDVRKSLLTYIPESVEDSVHIGKEYSAVCKYLPYKSITDTEKRVPDFPLLRVSEQYLIHAEAVLKGSNADIEAAAGDIKALEGRARGLAPGKITLLYSNKEDMMNLIERERVKELCYEGHRFFDLARWKKDVVRSSYSNAEVKLLKYEDHHFILPIPRMEMQANEYMVQNDDYPRL